MAAQNPPQQGCVARRTRSRIQGSDPPPLGAAPRRKPTTAAKQKNPSAIAGSSGRNFPSRWVAGAEADDQISWQELQQQLIRSFPGRSTEISELLRILGQPWDALPPLFIYGASATGKSSVVLELFHRLRRPFAYTSCTSCHSPRILFESILNQLTAHTRLPNNNYSSFKKCDKVAEFVRLLPEACEQAISERSNETPSPYINHAENGNPKLMSEDMWSMILKLLNTDLGRHYEASNDLNASIESSSLPTVSNLQIVYLIIDNVEQLRSWVSGMNLFNVLLKLSELTRLPNLGVILLSNVGLDSFMSGTGFREPQPLYFRGYTDEELHQILLNGRPNADLYSSFLNAALKPLTRITRRLTELSDILEPLFVKYSEPVVRGIVFPDDLGKRKLFSLFQPHLKSSLAQTFSISDALDYSSNELPSVTQKRIESKRTVDGGWEELDFHLSLCSKYLLLAAHICSTNPATLDASLFDAGGVAEKKKRRRKSLSSMDKRDQELQEKHLKGPSSFPSERLFAIFHCISVGPNMNGGNKTGSKLMDLDEGEPIECTADVMMQLSTLVRVNLILKGSTDILEGTARYRCNASDELIQKIARSVHFPLSKFLYYNTQL